MELTKKGEFIILSNPNINELFDFLKFQIKANIIFFDKNKNSRNGDNIVLNERIYESNKHLINVEINDIEDVLEYSELIEIIGKNQQKTKLPTVIMIPVDEFKKNEPLILLCGRIKREISQSCISISYSDNIFKILNKPFNNGDSDKLYYFELNDTILAFSQNGPVLITDNNNINSIEDAICEI